jgi:predicted Fe-Mo cluster-binding NifX family protein
MKVALTVWGKRISPVFDSAQMLLISEIENSKVIKRKYTTFNPESSQQLADLLNQQNVSVLICGAISEAPANIIETCGIKLIPFISGSAEDVLQLYAQSNSIIPSYLMPGCNHKCKRQLKNKGGLMPGKNGTGQKGKGRGKGSGKGRGMFKNNCGNNSDGQGSTSERGKRKGSGLSQGSTKDKKQIKQNK